MNLSTEEKLMDLENRPMVAQGEGEGVGGIGSLGLGMQTLAFKWINNEILLCSMRTMSRYLQHSMTMGEKIMYTCMCHWVLMLYSVKKSVLGEIIKINLKIC